MVLVSTSSRRSGNCCYQLVMSLEESRRTQRPYRYGMILLCVGALVNWLGLAEHYSEPIRYTGVACILAGACLICTAMCCWLHTPNRAGTNENDDPIHVISSAEERRCEKPPDYDTVAVAPPSYDDAIKLNPAALMGHNPIGPVSEPGSVTDNSSSPTTGGVDSANNSTSTTAAASSPSPTSSSSSPFSFSSIFLGRSQSQSPQASGTESSQETTVTATVSTENEKIREKPPPYEAPSSVAAIPAQLNPMIVVPCSN
ncbi:uncharacterized protein LOC129749308 isoform X2 [Uranotaenia lowii]|uniref:uncharacterized protein LOC129749308 isoform X2 n=1 Tax=Uranotaenia lowii TaxID=190385 RepID=UPI00247A0C21|nr:uncharacterized protein LOC129749308 isoform X2 [Uranotaenia lowii]